MRNGRPLRFLALTVGGWSAARALVLYQPDVPATITAATATAPRLGRLATRAAGSPKPVALRSVAPMPAARARPVAGQPARSSPPEPAGAPERRPPPSAAAWDGDRSDRDGAIPPPLRPLAIATGRSRLAGSAWLIARGGSGGTLLGGQLGGSQAGARLAYALGAARRVALSARVATPLAGAGREAAFGLDWQPTRAPLHLLAEQRVSLDGGRGGPTLLAIGGLPPTPVAAGFRLEAYAQAGAIKRDGVEAFGDGAARLTRPVAAIGRLRLDLGVGAWGAAQRGARRLDLGPTLGVVVPVGRKAARLTLDWRERVAGDARPGSGPALSLGADF